MPCEIRGACSLLSLSFLLFLLRIHTDLMLVYRKHGYTRTLSRAQSGVRVILAGAGTSVLAEIAPPPICVMLFSASNALERDLVCAGCL